MHRFRTSVRRAARITVGLSTLALASPAMAGLVVASSGPSSAQFPKGKKLDDDARVTLRKGDRVTVLDRSGTRVLRGPGRFSVSKPGRVLRNPAYAAFTRTKASQRATVAAVRGEDGEILSPNLWYIDLRAGGTHCLAAQGNLRLWRVEAKKGETVVIGKGEVSLANVEFEKDSILSVWDEAAAPAQDGAGYVLLNSRSEPVREVTFAMLEKPYADTEKLAEALIEKGCTAQLELLSQTLAID